MPIKTPLLDALGIAHPLLAPMAQVAGGRLAAAVSRAGALGLIGDLPSAGEVVARIMAEAQLLLTRAGRLISER